MARWLILLVVVLLLVWSTSAAAQTVSRVLIPGPFSVVLELGRWIVQGGDEVYEVRVQGAGADEAQAREQALRLAVQQAVGSLLLSQTEVQNQQLQQNQITMYSSGYVDRSQVIKQTRDEQGRTVLDMRVWVRRSAIADGLFGSATGTATIDGRRINDSWNSLKREQNSRDRTLSLVLSTFPKAAFDVKTAGTSWQVDTDRRPVLTMDVTVQWNQEWIKSFREVMKNINSLPLDHACRTSWSACVRNNLSVVYIRTNRSNWGHEISGWSDDATINVIRQHMVPSGLAVMTKLKGSQGQLLDGFCNFAQGWFGLITPTSYSQSIMIEVTESTATKVRLPVRESIIKDITSVEVSVVRQDQC